MEGKCEKKMWVDFRVLENLSPRRNGFALDSPLTFIFFFYKGKTNYEQKTPMTPIWKKWSAKTRFLSPGVRLPIGKVPHMR